MQSSYIAEDKERYLAHLAALAERYDEPWLFGSFLSFQKDGPSAYEARQCLTTLNMDSLRVSF